MTQQQQQQAREMTTRVFFRSLANSIKEFYPNTRANITGNAMMMDARDDSEFNLNFITDEHGLVRDAFDGDVVCSVMDDPQAVRFAMQQQGWFDLV